MVVDVIASGLHPRVRSQADGSHYTSSGELPLVPGIDGVGRAPDGTLRYFVLPDTTMGAMAEQTVIDRRRSIALAGLRRPDPGGRGDESRDVLVDRSSPAHRLRARTNGPDSRRYRQLRPHGRAGRQTPWSRSCHRRRTRRSAALGAQRRSGADTTVRPRQRCCGKRSRPGGSATSTSSSTISGVRSRPM